MKEKIVLYENVKIGKLPRGTKDKIKAKASKGGETMTSYLRRLIIADANS